MSETDPKKRHVFVWEDIWWTVVAEANSYWCDFKAYEWAGEDGQGPMYEAPRGVGMEGRTADLDKATPVITGSLKFDGCGNWEFTNAVHVCGRHSAAQFSAVILRMFDEVGPKVMSGWLEDKP